MIKNQEKGKNRTVAAHCMQWLRQREGRAFHAVTDMRALPDSNNMVSAGTIRVAGRAPRHVKFIISRYCALTAECLTLQTYLD